MKIVIYIFIFIYTIKAYSQVKVSPKLYSKDLKTATIFFENEDYINAINNYRNVLKIDPTNETANLNSLISRIKLNQVPDSSANNYNYSKNSKVPEIQFYMGKINHLNGNFDEAIINYNSYKNILPKYRTIANEEIEYNINCSKNAKLFTNQPHRSIIKNLGATINSKYPDYVPLITPDESILYFTSRREGGVGNLIDGDGQYFEDVYASYKTVDGKWGTPKNLGEPINTKTHDACVALSFDGNQLIIYRTSLDKTSGDLYTTQTDYEGWTVPVKLGPEINTPFIETSACFSTDTSVIYFSSDKPGGFGGKDIYRIKKTPSGRWSMPQNLGATINTDKDDDSPYLHPNGTELYFSSKGHNTMGDYDIFKTNLNPETNNFSEPENLGYPINTVYSDIFFVLNASGTHGYYSSIKEETFGGSDIYMIDTRFGDNDLKVKQGVVYFENKPIKAKITLIDIESKQVSGIYNTSAKTGKFILVMNPVKTYKAIIEEEGFENKIIDIDAIVNETIETDLIINLHKKQ